MTTRRSAKPDEQITANFNRKEFACKCGCGFDIIAVPFVDALQTFRDRLGVPIRVTSGCRCATHNQTVGGVKDSYHSKGLAADIVAQGLSPQQLYRAADLSGLFRGIGLYSGWIHVDYRPRTQRARWTA